MVISSVIVAFCFFVSSLVAPVAAHAHEGGEESGHLVHIEGTDPSEVVEEEPVVYKTFSSVDLSAAAKSLTVSFDKLTGIDASVKAKLEQARKLMAKVFASREFWAAVANHYYQRRKAFADNDGLSNEEIYDLIQLGKEKHYGREDRVMNLALEAYYENSSTVGYTYTRSKTIYINMKFYKNYSPAQMTRNLMHEWLHKTGFMHDQQSTAKRPYSVPYAVGAIVERLAKNI